MADVSIYEQLRSCLVASEFAPGQRLSPDALASRFGTSLSPIREALRQLTSEGFVERIPNQGTFVRQFTRQQLSDLVEVREVLECHTVMVAARRINASELYTLHTHVEQLEMAYAHLLEACRTKSDDIVEMLQRIAELDFEFHLSLFHAAGNKEIVSILHNNHAMVQMFGFRTDPPETWGRPDLEQQLLDNYAAHRAIYNAVENRESSEARQAMELHNKRARMNLFARFDAINFDQMADKNSPQGEFSDSFRKRIEGELKKP